MRGEEGKSERWYDSIKSHGKLTRKEMRVPAQPPGQLATCPPAWHLSLLFPLQCRSGIEGFGGEKKQDLAKKWDQLSSF